MRGLPNNPTIRVELVDAPAGSKLRYAWAVTVNGKPFSYHDTKPQAVDEAIRMECARKPENLPTL